MHVPALHADFAVILRQILGHALGQRRHQHPFIARNPVANHVQQVIDLALDRANLNRRIDQPSRSNDLLHHHARRLRKFVRPRSSRHVDDLIAAMFKLFES